MTDEYLVSCDVLANYGADTYRRRSHGPGSVHSHDPFLAWCYELGIREAMYVESERSKR